MTTPAQMRAAQVSYDCRSDTAYDARSMIAADVDAITDAVMDGQPVKAETSTGHVYTITRRDAVGEITEQIDAAIFGNDEPAAIVAAIRSAVRANLRQEISEDYAAIVRYARGDV